jgi:rubredoxin
MQSYVCTVCGYLYDVQSAERDVEGNLIPFEQLDPEWVCPTCGVRLDLFTQTDSDRVPDLTRAWREK